MSSVCWSLWRLYQAIHMLIGDVGIYNLIRNNSLTFRTMGRKVGQDVRLTLKISYQNVKITEQWIEKREVRPEIIHFKLNIGSKRTSRKTQKVGKSWKKEEAMVQSPTAIISLLWICVLMASKMTLSCWWTYISNSVMKHLGFYLTFSHPLKAPWIIKVFQWGYVIF